MIKYYQYVTYSECLSLALGTRHAMRMRRFILSVALNTPPFISTLSHKGQDNGKHNIENKMCFHFLYKFCLRHFSF